MARDRLLSVFLNANRFGNRDYKLLAGDASNRRYLELAGDPSLVVMDAPPEKGEDVRPFVAVTSLLRGMGYSAPQVFAADESHGFLLLEHLGPDLFARVVTPENEQILYGAAVDLLADLHARAPSAALPRYDISTYLREAHLLTEWYLPGTGRPAHDAAKDAFAEIMAGLCSPLPQTVPVLRDYHAENLIWRPDRSGHARVGLLDYQDALIGHPAYDLVSLLEDARRDTSPSLRETMLERYIMASGADDEAFRRAYAVLGAQRNIKILGIFARLWLRDGKANYLDLMPRVWAHLEGDLRHPALHELADWVEAHVPAPEEGVRARIQAAR